MNRGWLKLAVQALAPAVVACGQGTSSPVAPEPTAGVADGCDASPPVRDAAARVDAPVVAQDAAGNVAMDAGSDPEAGGAGCGLAVPSGDATWTLTSGGLTRTLTVHVPASYDPAQTTPLVLDFHGEFSDGAQQDELSGMSAKADAEGFIAMFPEGIGGSWNAGGDCCGTALQENVDDVGFVSDILETAAVRLCVDPRRVFVTGMSNGAYLAQRLGCALADRIAAIAPVAGVLSVPPACDPSQPVPVMEFHGTADLLVPYDGGGTTEEPSVPDTFAGWAARDQCSGAPQSTYQSGDVGCSSYLTCAAGAVVTLCTVTGGGHTWPGGMAVPLLGYTTTDISATDAMWTFFQAHPLP